MRIALTGARGLLGSELVGCLRDHHHVDPFDVDDFDITDPAATRRIIGDCGADVVVHAAACTDVDGCESDPDLAMRVNAFGTKNVALGARDAGARLVAVSTDYVFDGLKGEPYDEADAPSPLGVYGRSKLLGERLAGDIAPRCTIVRTQALFGPGGRNFIDAILDAVDQGKPLKVVADQVTCPTYAPHLARQIARIVDEGTEGLYHVSAGGACSWLELAKAALAATGHEGVDVEPLTTEQLGRPAPRPANGALRNMHLELTIGDGMPSWNEGLLAHLRGRGRT
jgi:dTDP-4-dehydrorhamnose reductase